MIQHYERDESEQVIPSLPKLAEGSSMQSPLMQKSNQIVQGSSFSKNDTALRGLSLPRINERSPKTSKAIGKRPS